MNIYNNINNIDFVFPQQGFTLATPVTCLPPLDNIKFTNAASIVWYFGDGSFINVTQEQGLSATHVYTLPGSYVISAVALYSVDNIQYETLMATASCKIINYVDCAIYFTTVPPPAPAGFYTEYPYKIIFTSSNLNEEPIIDLYSQFSLSYPPQDKEHKWSFVRPEWKFVDLSGNKISSIKPQHYPVRIDSKGNISPSGTIVGLSGSAEFYFIDDMYNLDLFYTEASTPIVWASMPTSAINYSKDTEIKSNNIYSYSTTDVKAYAPHTSFWIMPNKLKITENGARDFLQDKWAGADIPFFVSAYIDPSTFTYTQPYNIDSYFVKYMPHGLIYQNNTFLPAAEDITVNITALSTVSASFDVSSTKNAAYTFNQIDSTGFCAPGFARGLVKVYDETVIQLSASAYIDFNKLHLPGPPKTYSPYLWIPNPVAGSLSIVYYTGTTNTQFATAVRQSRTNYMSNVFTPIVTNLTTTSTNLTGFNGMYAVATAPGTAPDYQYYAWVADSDLDIIYKYNTAGKILTSINLKNIFNLSKLTPAGLALDSEKNLWVTCYDTLSALKFNSNGEYILSVKPPAAFAQINPNIPGLFDISPENNIFDDVVLVEPTCIDTDTEDNVWISYSNTLSGVLVKYNKNGEYITSITTPLCSTPQEIKINADNSLWVAETYESINKRSILKRYSPTGVILYQSGPISNIGYLTIDTNDNLWFTYDYNKIGKVATNNIFTAVKTVTSSYEYENLNVCPLTGTNSTVQINALEGITCNSNNFIFVVHSIDNKIYVYNASTSEHVDTLHIMPHLSIGIYNDYNKNNQHNNIWNKSIQVIGDWSGFDWSRKYQSNTNSISSRYVTGVSKKIIVNKNNPQEIRKHNQDFNMTEHFKNLALAPNLRNSEFLFDVFIKSIYGTSQDFDDIGTTFYEKISNFLDNHNNIDTCEIDNLYNLAEFLDIQLQDYRLSYPARLKQVMNLLSISHSKLWGIKCKCNNFKNSANYSLTDVCKFCGKYKQSVRGESISMLDPIIVGKPIVVYEKAADMYFTHYPATVNDMTTYPVNFLTAAGFDAPVSLNYDFYTYIEPTSSNYIEGIIDWENKNTTLSYNISSYNDWIKSGGVMDTILNYYLYKGLNLI